MHKSYKYIRKKVQEKIYFFTDLEKSLRDDNQKIYFSFLTLYKKRLYSSNFLDSKVKLKKLKNIK